MSKINPEEKRKYIIGYIICGSILIAGIVSMLFIRQVFSQTDTKSVISALSDSFLVPGVLLMGVGGLSKLAALGAYDTIGYLFSRFSFHSFWVTGAKKKKYDSLYDYKQEKDQKGRSWLPYALWTGVGSCMVSVILLIIYLSI
ncbi:MAG: DUF3899 domain-containing protein [Clostridiales bacterium]|nr:DUF3899 domain-containing protein [Clostridiales bacterium]